MDIAKLQQQLIDRQEQLIERKRRGMESTYEFSQELSDYDNHPADTGSELFDKEKDSALQRHIEQELSDINEALHAMEEGTYGICKVCGEPIASERLEALPTADCCVEHAKERPPATDTPTRITKTVGDDGENSWEDVSQYGTSSNSPWFDEQ
ncbi:MULTISPECIES: TraR/DksA C4-type zinc finger protein [Gracilibacillus]|uniref:TraR/DksA C4-type zinc finger protein n=1 Tax=Gracilibacillus TaxID=74385 RepID=UPI00082656A5|nr:MULTISPECIES: TraR/DksA C4-type zinc finger protein [Gracilibacillus]